MSLSNIPLPKVTFRPDLDINEFFSRCSTIAKNKDWVVESSKDYIKIFINPDQVHLIFYLDYDSKKKRLLIDVISKWKTISIEYDEYVSKIKASFNKLSKEYKKVYKKQLRLHINIPVFDTSKVNYQEIAYARECFSIAVNLLTIGKGEIRKRLYDVYISIHRVPLNSLPEPLRSQFKLVIDSLTLRPKRLDTDSKVKATLDKMRKSTGSNIANQVLKIKLAIDELYNICLNQNRK